MTDRFSDYDPFAWLYTRYWGEVFHTEALPAIERLILSRLPRRAEVLDLCCGDGRLTKALERRRFRVTGLDGSEQMLTYARRRVPKATFLLEDARAFRLPPTFDAVISTFDSLNHVMSIAGLRQVIRNAFRCLKPGGYFVFDLNREEAYTTLWARTSSTVDDEVVSVARGAFFPRTRLATCDITLLRRDGGRWRRSDFQMRQRCHAREDVKAALEKVGFTTEVFDARALGMSGDIGFGRDFYLAQKPADPSR